MAVEIKVPTVGESISEVQIGEWYIKEGTWVKNDTEIVGLETDKATFDVPAPADGKITRILVEAGQMAAVGDVIGYFEEAPQPEGESSPSEDKPAPKAASKAPAQKASSSNGNDPIVMPAAARALAEKGLQASAVTPTGPGGRLLKEDVLSHDTTAMYNGAPLGDAARSEEVIPMSPIRKRIAERLVEAQQTAALLTTFNEVDMTAIKSIRSQYQDSFVKSYGIKLGFMSFFVKAVVDAMNQVPAVGAKIRGTDLVYPNYYDIGIAVGGGKGLVVPILRNTERMSFAEIELAIADMAQRASKNKIGLEELEGGCFTISNGGIYGSLLSTPIVNPPQSGVLGMHSIVDRPVALNGEVVIRPMMYIALTYDHRVVDGKGAVTFLKRIKESIEDPARMILEV